METRPQRSAITTLAAIAAVGLAVVAANGDTRVVYVDAAGPSDGDGTSWTRAYRDPQVAFNSFNALPFDALQGDDIQFRIAQGTYRAARRRECAFYFEPGPIVNAAKVTIAGGYGGLASPTPDSRDFVNFATILTADVLGDDAPGFMNRDDNCDAVFSPVDPDEGTFQRTCRSWELSGVVLENAFVGSFDKNGGGFRVSVNREDSPINTQVYRFTDCTIRNNMASGNGGGIGVNSDFFSQRVDVEMLRCRVQGNVSFAFGGGACLTFPVYASFSDCIVAENLGQYGGGGIATDYGVVIQRCILADNTSQGRGGAVLQDYPNLSASVSDSLVTGNSASYGGGMCVQLGNAVRSTFVNNSAAFGGGLFTTGVASLQGSLFTGNSASVAGNQLAGTTGLSAVHDSCIAGGAAGCYFPFDLNPPPTILDLRVEFVDPDGPDNDPDTWEDNNFRLVPSSPLIDRGGVAPLTATDLDGRSRQAEGILGRGARSDIGCYESQLALCPADLDADQAITIDDLLDFLHAFELGDALADLTTNGLTPRPDGAVTVEDLLFFLSKFEQGC